MKLDDGRLTFVAQQEVTALDAIHKAVLGKAACAGRVTEGVGTCISIHAPTWGATFVMARASLPLPYFNPRTHVGCDTSQMRSVRLWNDFNPRTHVGCDRMNVSVTYSYRNFNPRTHVGCDPIQKLLCVHLLNFNPRTHVGCDENFVDTFRFFLMISIHAPTWGATYNAFTLLYSVLFQSTHPRGVRPQRFSEYKFMGDISIHAPTWGATQNPC